ncbi:MAG: hypothetical protein QW404_02475 [Candidatus Nanoarchaeia archaeon]
MGLVEKIKEIARQQNIPESELIMDEVEWFMKEHKGHGRCEIILRYDEKENCVNGIYLECLGDELKGLNNCPHMDIDTPPELLFSIVYLKEKTSEIEIQKLRREGKINDHGTIINKEIIKFGYS